MSLPDHNPSQSTIDELVRAMRTIRHIKHPARMVASDLTPSERHLLQSVAALIEGQGAARPGDVAARTRIRPSAVTPTIASLEARGLVRRQADPSDRRAVNIVLTDEGQATSARIRAAVEAQLAGLADRLGDADAREFARLVTLVADYFIEVNQPSLTEDSASVGDGCA